VDLLKVLKPKYFIPVEGLYRYLIDISNYVSETFAKNEVTPIVLQNGKIAHFLNGKLFSTNGRIKPCGDTIIDGFGVGDISTEVISERELLGREGLVIVSLIFNSRTKEIDSNIKTNYIGVIGREDKAEIDKLIKSVIIQVTQDEQFKGLKDLQERLRKVIRKKIYKIYDKEPMVAITFNAD
ncbi:ribonuclease J, partial [Mycoplasmopsis pullorum]